MADTLLIDTDNWDLCVDAAGHIAVCENPYALAQGAACAIKAFRGENYYNTQLGIPYYETILGKSPPLSLIKAELVAAAKTVPEVVDARAFIASITNGVVTGQVQVVDASGATLLSEF